MHRHTYTQAHAFEIMYCSRWPNDVMLLVHFASNNGPSYKHTQNTWMHIATCTFRDFTFFRPLFLLLFLRSPIELARARTHASSQFFSYARPIHPHCLFIVHNYLLCILCKCDDDHSKSRKSIANIAHILYGRLVKW